MPAYKPLKSPSRRPKAQTPTIRPTPGRTTRGGRPILQPPARRLQENLTPLTGIDRALAQAQVGFQDWINAAPQRQYQLGQSIFRPEMAFEQPIWNFLQNQEAFPAARNWASNLGNRPPYLARMLMGR